MQTHHHVVSYTPTSVQAFAARNLQLLRVIESTVDSLTADTRILQAMFNDLQPLTDAIRSQGSEGDVIDPEQRVCNQLQQAMDTLARMHATATHKHAAACNDHRLTEDDGVADAWSDYMQAMQHMHDALHDLHDAVATHDALVAPVQPQVYGSAEELFKALGIPAA